jgi:hypothetical protein
MRRTGRLVVAVAIAAALAAGTGSCIAAAAETPTRREYVLQLEPVCKPGADETQRVMKGVKDDVDGGRLAVAAGKFGQAGKIFGKTVKTIARVPQPAADTVRLKQWFVYLNRQEAFLGQISAQLRAKHTIKAQRLTSRFIQNGNAANNVVLAFGFDYCSFRFSRFG